MLIYGATIGMVPLDGSHIQTGISLAKVIWNAETAL